MNFSTKHYYFYLVNVGAMVENVMHGLNVEALLHLEMRRTIKSLSEINTSEFFAEGTELFFSTRAKLGSIQWVVVNEKGSNTLLLAILPW
jgi:hypothetical protein